MLDWLEFICGRKLGHLLIVMPPQGKTVLDTNIAKIALQIYPKIPNFFPSKSLQNSLNVPKMS